MQRPMNSVFETSILLKSTTVPIQHLSLLRFLHVCLQGDWLGRLLIHSLPGATEDGLVIFSLVIFSLPFTIGTTSSIMLVAFELLDYHD